MVSVSLGSVISLSLSGDSFEWEFVRIEWVLWSGEWSGLKLSESFPLSIMLGVHITVSVMITISLGSVIGLSLSRDGLERKLIGVEWVLWSSKWGGVNLSKSFPLSIVLGINITISIVVSISLGSVISLSLSRDSFKWKLIRVEWVLWGGERSGLGLSKGSIIVLGVDITISIVIFESLGSIISFSFSSDILEWEFVGVCWVLWS